MSTDDLIKLVTVTSPVVLAFIVFFTGQGARRDARNAAKAAQRVENKVAVATDVQAVNTEQTTAKLDLIHVLVNSRLTEALKKIDRLEQALQGATGRVPTGEPPVAPLDDNPGLAPPRALDDAVRANTASPDSVRLPKPDEVASGIGSQVPARPQGQQIEGKITGTILPSDATGGVEATIVLPVMPPRKDTP